MRDLNDLRVFERVALLGSFSAAAKALGMPKSSVSRGISRLEDELGARLFQRNTRDVTLTAAGVALQERCAAILERVGEAVDYFQGLGRTPAGRLRVSAGIGFGINVLGKLLPEFIAAYPHIDVSLDLSSRHVDLIAEGFDVAIRLGPMVDSRLVARRLGAMDRLLCAAPGYLARAGTPQSPDQLSRHWIVEMPGTDGRPRSWHLTRGDHAATVDLQPRIEVNEALTIHRLLLGGAGIGCLSGYVCAADRAAGRLVHVLPEWRLPRVEVNAVFPSSKALSTAIRVFVDFLVARSTRDDSWCDPDPDRVTPM